LKKYAEEVGLEIAKFEGCLSGPVLKAAVQRDIGDGNRLGVTGTPAFFHHPCAFAGSRKGSASKNPPALCFSAARGSLF
jgi:predicted DsbA family dithiol-disulfide isomerase